MDVQLSEYHQHDREDFGEIVEFALPDSWAFLHKRQEMVYACVNLLLLPRQFQCTLGHVEL